jgi:hypothetical protein
MQVHRANQDISFLLHLGEQFCVHSILSYAEIQQVKAYFNTEIRRQENSTVRMQEDRRKMVVCTLIFPRLSYARNQFCSTWPCYVNHCKQGQHGLNHA